MHQLITFVKKEFWHVLRDRRTLMVLFGMPIVQILLFGFALSTEVKNTKIGILDQDKSQNSLELSSKIAANQYFDLAQNLKSINEAEDAFKGGKIKMIVVIPAQFDQNLSNGKKAQIQLISDGTDLNLANQIYNFMSQIVMDFYRQKTFTEVSGVQPEIRMLYNPQLKGAPNFVPGVMAFILLIICVLMTAIAIVREKETGTMEILLVSPMKPYIIILAKAIPYFILSLIILVSILILSVTVLDLPIKGNIFFTLRNQHYFHHYQFVSRHRNFHFNGFSTNRNAHFPHRNHASNPHVERIYVSRRKYAASFTTRRKCNSRKMVLRNCKKYHDQRNRFRSHLETRSRPFWDDDFPFYYRGEKI